MTCSSITLLKFSFQISSSFYLSLFFPLFFFSLLEPPSLFNPCFSVELALVHGSHDTMNSSPTPVLTHQQQQFLHAAAKCSFRLFSFIFSSHIPFLLPFPLHRLFDFEPDFTNTGHERARNSILQEPYVHTKFQETRQREGEREI